MIKSNTQGNRYFLHSAPGSNYIMGSAVSSYNIRTGKTVSYRVRIVNNNTLQLLAKTTTDGTSGYRLVQPVAKK